MLQLQNISKHFPGVKALDDVSLEFKAGQIHALCGENGAGKSTLMNIVAGNLQPGQGRILWKGQPVSIANFEQARALGIGIVYQERSLADALSVAENIFPENQPLNRWGFIDFRTLFAQAQELLDQLKIAGFLPGTTVAKLSAGQKQMLEIAKALAAKPQLLILDEPTASISEKETEILFQILRELKEKGVAIIYISHRMAEIMAIADTVSVLKDGRHQKTLPATATTIGEIIRLMVGRELQTAEFQRYNTNEVLLEVKNLSGKGFSGISFQLHKGEILGLAGLVGAGRTEIARAVFGAEPATAGQILKHGKQLSILHPADAIQNRIAYLPEERKMLGGFQPMSIEDNIMAGALEKVSRNGRLDFSEIRKKANFYITQLAIRTPSPAQPLCNLSGGNQQKVVLAKWLFAQPEILIVDEPTHGVDVGAKREIYAILKQLSSEGIGIILISSELSELLLLADRFVVIHEGRQTATLERSEASEEQLLRYASGQDANA